MRLSTTVSLSLHEVQPNLVRRPVEAESAAAHPTASGSVGFFTQVCYLSLTLGLLSR